MKRALVTGITGQDGSYLAELLLSKGYAVHGIMRRTSSFNTHRIDHLYHQPRQESDALKLHYGDLTDGTNISGIVKSVLPDEVYNLGAQSHVKISFEVPEYSTNVDGLGTIRLLDALRTHCPECRFYQASTSELYGRVQEIPQTESTPFYPRSPYAAAKLYAYWITINYREAYGLHACNGILFNHESPRRGENFVTRKITLGAARIKRGGTAPIRLGNLNAKRDWGYAPEYMEAAWRMLQQDTPEEFVIATGQAHTVREFASAAFQAAGFDPVWDGEGIHERAVDKSSGQVLVEINPAYFRPTEVDILVGDAFKAEKILGWKPTTTFNQLVKLMVENDIDNEN